MLAFRNLSILIRYRKQIMTSRQYKNFHKKGGPIPVAWERPAVGWTKLNFDGSSRGKAGIASIGGVFRNHEADLLLAYAEPIGIANSTAAEFAALKRGLELALENGWSPVWIEGDAKGLVETIGNYRREAWRISHAGRINEIIPWLDGFVVSHVYREANRAADRLAQMGYGLKKPRVWRVDDPPPQVLRILREDAEGKVIFRRK